MVRFTATVIKKKLGGTLLKGKFRGRSTYFFSDFPDRILPGIITYGLGF